MAFCGVMAFSFTGNLSLAAIGVFAYLIGCFAGKLDGENGGAGGLRKEKTAFSPVLFLLIDTIEKIQHTIIYLLCISEEGNRESLCLKSKRSYCSS